MDKNQEIIILNTVTLWKLLDCNVKGRVGAGGRSFRQIDTCFDLIEINTKRRAYFDYVFGFVLYNATSFRVIALSNYMKST